MSEQLCEQRFKQIALDGSLNDYDSVDELDNIRELRKAIKDFFTANKEYNPRQLQYIVAHEAEDVSLDELISW